MSLRNGGLVSEFELPVTEVGMARFEQGRKQYFENDHLLVNTWGCEFSKEKDTKSVVISHKKISFLWKNREMNLKILRASLKTGMIECRIEDENGNRYNFNGLAKKVYSSSVEKIVCTAQALKMFLKDHSAVIE